MVNIGQLSMVQLAAYIATQLKQKKIDVVLVGGLAVACYTDNRYLTKDIDMVDISLQTPKNMQKAMQELGFYKQGRVYVSDQTDIIVEFPSAPLSVGDELITEQTIYRTEYGNIPILRATDVVKDRLAAYFHWQDQQSLVQALCVMLCHSINSDQFEAFAENEGMLLEFEWVQAIYNELALQECTNIDVVEKFVVAKRLAEF